jgi:hypothetical protein
MLSANTSTPEEDDQSDDDTPENDDGKDEDEDEDGADISPSDQLLRIDPEELPKKTTPVVKTTRRKQTKRRVIRKQPST